MTVFGHGGGQTGQSPSGWTVDTLHEHVVALITQMQASLNERAEAQQKAVDTAFRAHQAATEIAFTAADKAVTAALAAADQRAANIISEFHEHLQQYRNEVTMAFEASSKAIDKAEAATEKRFDAANEFRGQLSDQAARFMPRTEAEAAINRNAERMQEMSTAMSGMVTRSEVSALSTSGQERFQTLVDRVTASENRANAVEGRGTGLNSAWVYLLGAVAALGTIISLYIANTGK